MMDSIRVLRPTTSAVWSGPMTTSVSTGRSGTSFVFVGKYRRSKSRSLGPVWKQVWISFRMRSSIAFSETPAFLSASTLFNCGVRLTRYRFRSAAR